MVIMIFSPVSNSSNHPLHSFVFLALFAAYFLDDMVSLSFRLFFSFCSNRLNFHSAIFISEMYFLIDLVLAITLSLVFLLISNLTNGHRLHQFLETKTTKANKSLKTDAN